MALTNDDLLAISQLLDVKLKAEIQPIKNEIQSVKNEIQSVKAELQGEIQSVKAELQGEIQSVKAELQGEIQSVKAELQGEIQFVKADLYSVKAEIHQIKLFQENTIMPQLNTIQACYTSTYNRYKDSVEGYERLEADNELMKQIIMEHSRKLQKLA
ncbi:MAG: OmpH family outer membrane protein [Lachnospiraceae bacterium]|jgi:gas vesicle protein|nr:OmpH family outer membrane protein [Lachnospiraceae bacterium]